MCCASECLDSAEFSRTSRQALFKIGSFAKPALPDDISQDCIDFLNATFELDYNNRPSADELLQHPFITGEFTGPANSAAASTADDTSNSSAANASTLTAGNSGTVRSRKQASNASRKAREAAQASGASTATNTEADTSG